MITPPRVVAGGSHDGSGSAAARTRPPGPVPPRRRHPPLPLLLVAGAVTLLLLLPVGYVAWLAADLGPARLAELVLRERVARLFWSTVGLVVVTVPLTVVIGVAAAWVVERTDLPGRRVWGVLLAAPLAVPAFVTSYAWLGVDPSLGGLGGGVLIAVSAYFPLVYLPAAATLRWIDPAEEEVARSLGLSGVAVALRPRRRSTGTAPRSRW